MAIRKSKQGGGTLLERIDALLDEWEKRTGRRIDDKTFGWYFSNPRFLETLRKGGYPRPPSIEACEEYMRNKRAEWAVDDAKAKAAPKKRRRRA